MQTRQHVQQADRTEITGSGDFPERLDVQVLLVGLFVLPFPPARQIATAHIASPGLELGATAEPGSHVASTAMFGAKGDLGSGHLTHAVRPHHRPFLSHLGGDFFI